MPTSKSLLRTLIAIAYSVSLAVAPLLGNETSDNSENAQAVREVLSGQRTIANAAWWGFDKKDAQDKMTSYQLVEWLGHDHVAVRQLAFYHVGRLTGRRFDYGPILPSAQRRSAADPIGRPRCCVSSD